MEVQKKLNLLEEMLEMDENTLSAEMELDDLDNWDSMAKLSLIVLMDENFGKTLSGEELKTFSTVQDILDYME